MGNDHSLQRLSLWLMAASLAVVLGFYGLPEIVHRVTRAVEQGRSEAAGVQLKKLHDTSDAFRLVAKRVSPAVVNVSNLAVVSRPTLYHGPGGRLQIGEESRFWHQGEGSGFVIDPRGYIVTNRHVVVGAKQVRVRFPHGTEQVARIVGSDPDTDLAVLQVQSNDLVSAEFGDSDEAEVGDWVLAIGNPFGRLQQSVTAGIISAKGRTGIVEELDIQDFLQTDAAINPGNSGGPLVDLRGQVVGVNSAIWSQSGGFEGVSFAIPSKIAKSIVTKLISTGKVTRGWLGIRGKGLSEWSQATPRPEGLVAKSGVVVIEVVQNSPAAKSGIEVGDVILSIGTRRVQSLEELRTQVATSQIGEKTRVEIDRKGEQRELMVQIAEQPAGLPWLEDQLGLSVTDLTPETAERFGLAPNHGVLVTLVTNGSPADGAGLRKGDVIVAVGREEVTTMDQFISTVQRADVSKGVALGVESPNGRRRFVVIGQ